MQSMRLIVIISITITRNKKTNKNFAFIPWDLKDWNISKDIALDRSAWRLAINVPKP